MNDHFLVKAMKEGIFDQRIALYIAQKTFHPHSIAVAEPLSLVPLEDELSEPQPVMYMNETEAQVLIDSLWDCGLRPSEGSGSAGALMAVQEHLVDMRKIAFKGLEIK